MNEYVVPIAVIGFKWGAVWRRIQRGNAMFRRAKVPVCFQIVEPSRAKIIINKLDRWQVLWWIGERGLRTPGEVAVANKHTAGWWHEVTHLLLGNDPRWNNHQSRASLEHLGAKWKQHETIMGVTPNWVRAMRLSAVDKLVVTQRLPLL